MAVFKRIVTQLFYSFLCVAMSISPLNAQGVSSLFPSSTVLGSVSNPAQTLLLRGLKVNVTSPMNLEFVADIGDSIESSAIKEDSERLMRYFMAAVAIPKDEIWVNLSPYESDRIIPDPLAQTELGRDLLAQDYLLKQLTASLFHPEGDVGQEFWQRVYARAYEQYGTTDIPVETFHKVWIMPDHAKVYEDETGVYIMDATLEVMLERDFFAEQKNRPTPNVIRQTNGSSRMTYELMTYDHDEDDLSSDIMRSVIIPAIKKEVNEGVQFSLLRQIYYAVILAEWYKDKIKESIINDVYAGKSLVSGIDIDPQARTQDPERVYAQYVTAFKKGVFDFVLANSEQLTANSSNNEVVRRYFSGGARVTGVPRVSVDLSDGAMAAKKSMTKLEVAIDALHQENPELALELAALYVPIEQLQESFWGRMVEMSDAMGEDGDIQGKELTKGNMHGSVEIAKRLGLSQSAVSHMFKSKSTARETQFALSEVYIDYFELEENAVRWKSIEQGLRDLKRLTVENLKAVGLYQLSVGSGVSVNNLSAFIYDNEPLTSQQVEKLVNYLSVFNAQDDAKLLRNYAGITRFLKHKIRQMSGLIDEYGNHQSKKGPKKNIVISRTDLGKRVGVSQSALSHYLDSDAMELAGFVNLINVIRELGDLTPEEEKMIDDAERWDAVLREHIKTLHGTRRLTKISKSDENPDMLSQSALSHYLQREYARIESKNVRIVVEAVIEELKLDETEETKSLQNVLWWQEQLQKYLKKIYQGDGLEGFASKHHFNVEQLQRWMRGEEGVPQEIRTRLIFVLDEHFGISRAASKEKRIAHWHDAFIKAIRYLPNLRGSYKSIYEGIVSQSRFSRWVKRGRVDILQAHKNELVKRVKKALNIPTVLPEAPPLSYVPDMMEINGQEVLLQPLTETLVNSEAFSSVREEMGEAFNFQKGYGSYVALDREGQPVAVVMMENDPDQYHVTRLQSVYIHDQFKKTGLAPWILLKAITDLRIAQPHKARLVVDENLDLPEAFRWYDNPEDRYDIHNLAALKAIIAEKTGWSDSAMKVSSVDGVVKAQREGGVTFETLDVDSEREAMGFHVTPELYAQLTQGLKGLSIRTVKSEPLETLSQFFE